MVGEHADDYSAGLPPEWAAELTRVNAPGLAALRKYLDSGEAVAFLGAGVSAPLYPLWAGLIGELVDAAAGRLSEARGGDLPGPGGSAALRRSWRSSAAAWARPSYHAVLREVLRVRTDPESGRSWTAVQELVCRCAFQGRGDHEL